MKNTDWLRQRLENQLRIHWKWLMYKNPKEVVTFIMAIIENNEVELPENEPTEPYNGDPVVNVPKFVAK